MSDLYEAIRPQDSAVQVLDRTDEILLQATNTLDMHMPESHGNYDADPATLSVQGLIKNCPYYADLYKQNPELAETRAAEIVLSAKETDAMRQSGVSEQTIKSQKFAAMRERHQSKVENEVKQEVEELRLPEQKPTNTTVMTQQTIVPEHIHQAMRIITAEPISDIKQEKSKPVEPQQSKVAAKKPETPLTQPVVAHQPKQTTAPLAVLQKQSAPEIPVILEPSRAKNSIVAPVTVHARIQPIEGPGEVAGPNPLIKADEMLQLIGEHLDLEDTVIEPMEAAQVTQVQPLEEPIAQETIEPNIVEQVGFTPLIIPEATPSVTKLIELISPITESNEATINPIVEDILEIVQISENLTDPEFIETTRVELEELVIELCEQLDIAYKPEDVEQFIAILRRQEFQQLMFETKFVDKLDLEHLGTHEAKHRFGKRVSGMAKDVEGDIKQLLGMLVLFHAAKKSLWPRYSA